MAPPGNSTPPKASKQQQQRPPLPEEADTTLSLDSDRKRKKKKKHHLNQEEAPMAAFAGSKNGEKGRTHKQNPQAERNRNKEDTKKAKRKQLSRQIQVEEEEKWRTKKQKLRNVGTTEEDGNTKKRKEKDEKKNKWKKWANEGDGEGLIRDTRFASAHWDPRFQIMPKRESKVVIDSRFSRLFTDERFGNSSAPMDKRGKRVREKESNPLLRYYLPEEEVGRDVDEEKREEDEIASGSDEESASEEEGSDGSGVDSDTSSSEEEESYDEDQYAVESDVLGFWMGNHEGTPTIENETRRLAVVNMDWDHIKAVDLYLLMSTCLLTSCPQNGGQILSVAIYPSEFGLKCMEIEAIRGPHALFDDENDPDNSDEVDDIDDKIVNEKIRSYQLKRLKYYFAVVDCDSSATANHLYNALDGVEFLKTANILDLRFIPDSMEFKHPHRDIATEAPADYKLPDFETLALQHSSVKLTWDDDEPNRKKILRRKFNPDKMDELEQYLASEESDDDNDESDEDHREKYHALLQLTDASGTDEDNDSSKEMEVTFLPGVENLSKHIDKSKLNKSEEGVWEAYLRKRREKIKARKKGSKLSSEDESSDSERNEAPQQPDDFFVEEPSGSDAEDGKRNGKKGKLRGANKKSWKDRRHAPEIGREEETREASRAELELLLANDDAEHLKGFNLRPKKVKRKKGKEVPVEDKLPEVDASNDPRFSSRLTSHIYALDPTDPQYKRSATGMKQARTQKQRKGNVKVVAAVEEEKIRHLPSDEKPLKEKHEIMSLVRSLKLKSKGLGRNGREEGDV